MTDILKIAMVQTHLYWEDPERNRNHLGHKIDAIDTDTDLILLPEMFQTGFSMNTTWAEEMDGTTIQWILQKAQAMQSHIAGSLMVQDGDRVFNRLVVASPSGEIVHYDKRHLFSMATEDQYFSSGDRQQIVVIGGFKILLQICYDLRFPVWSRNRWQDGEHLYDALLYVANWPSVRGHIWRNLLQARAIENMAYVMGVNRIGEDAMHMQYDGDSLLIDPWGTIQQDVVKGSDTILYGVLDKKILHAAREKFPVGKDADDFELR